LAAGESSLKLLGKHTSSRKPPNQLQTRFRAKLRTALINQNGVGDVTESTRITQAAVAVEQRLGAVGDLAADVGRNAVLAPAYPCANWPQFLCCWVLIHGQHLRATSSRKLVMPWT